MREPRANRILYFSAASNGGLADYAREQANALAHLGTRVDLLTGPEFSRSEDDQFTLLPHLCRPRVADAAYSRIASRLATIQRILRDVRVLTKCVITSNHRHILLGSYSEYLAPLWSRGMMRLSQSDITFGAVVHDPVRDFVVGPLWWHRWSVRCGYSFLREAFVHAHVQLDTVRPMPRLRTTVVPHGTYRFPPATRSSQAARKALDIPEEAFVLLAFGHLRDGKNLELAIKMLPEFPAIYLVIAGKEQSLGQKPASYYQHLANSLAVNGRCRWLVRYIPTEEVGALFEAADVSLLTYSRNFRSASGVLNASVHYRTPCLASSGSGNLQSVVQKYGLGVWVGPDSMEAMASGLRKLQTSPPRPRWAEYERENCWARNAELVSSRLFEVRS